MTTPKQFHWKRQDALDFIAGARGGINAVTRNYPGIRNTTVRREPSGDVIMRYHATDIITWHLDGAITLSTGGVRGHWGRSGKQAYGSVTTKSRIGDFTPFHIWQDKFNWFLVGAGSERPDSYAQIGGRKVLKFYSGIKLVPTSFGGGYVEYLSTATI